jgi:hypothetical protein
MRNQRSKMKKQNDRSKFKNPNGLFEQSSQEIEQTGEIAQTVSM